VKRFERHLEAIRWYQNETYFTPLICSIDEAPLIGRAHIGQVYLECPLCGLRQYQIPEHVIKLFNETNDIPTNCQLQEAKSLAKKLGKTLPESVLESAMQLANYTKSIRGKVVELESE
jgi:hypothetical protein